MTVIKKFLGHQLEIPDDLRYDVKQGLWGKCVDLAIAFGLSQPALILSGGVKDLDILVEENQTVRKGDTILFAITGKLLYLEAPVGGIIQFNRTAMEKPSMIITDPYDQGWLFLIQPDGVLDRIYQALSSPQDYLEKLKVSEGFKNPEGLKGGVSGICKAVYTGIGQQKI